MVMTVMRAGRDVELETCNPVQGVVLKAKDAKSSQVVLVEVKLQQSRLHLEHKLLIVTMSKVLW